MKVLKKKHKRYFQGSASDLELIADCGHIYLEANEQITFVSANGKEYDFCAKSWGFYATPSINKRLRDQGYKTALVRNVEGKLFIMVVMQEAFQEFDAYIKQESCQIVEWLDQRKLTDSL